MFIVSQNNDCIVNVDHIADIYSVGSDVVAMLANTKDKATVILGRYNGSEESRMAVVYISSYFKDVNVTNLLQMPSSKTIHALMIGNNKWHHATGKKTKGHGGS